MVLDTIYFDGYAETVLSGGTTTTTKSYSLNSLHLAVVRETIHTTQKHPWLTSRGWITAGQLHIGDQVQQLDGTTATVVSLRVIAGAASMYDLTISNVHTFAVGTSQFVVHNCSGDLSEAGIKDTLSNKGATMTNTTDSLPYNENRVYLGHYGGKGNIINGMDFPSVRPGLRMMETFAVDYGGKVLDDLPGTMEAIQPHIEAANEILFNIGRGGIEPGSLTAQEFHFVIGNVNILRKTIFLFGQTY